MSITTLSAQQLRKAADVQEKIETLEKELNGILGGEAATPAVAAAPANPGASEKPTNGRKKRKKLSAQGIANIRAGVAKRMAKKGAKANAANVEEAVEKPKRKISPAGRAAMAAAAKARWAKAKSAGKTTL